MNSFGGELRAFRLRAGLTQAGLAAAIGGQVSRSSIANIEAGRQSPSIPFWQAFESAFPDDSQTIRQAYLDARLQPATSRGRTSASKVGAEAVSSVLGGPFCVERLDIVYVFRESHSPEEIVEFRQVRALRNGAHDFRLKYEHQGSTKFESVPEVLFGGQLVDETRQSAAGETIYLRRIDFQRTLRRGAHHDFCLRYWVEHNPELGDAVAVAMTNRAETVKVHLKFLGTSRPAAVWRFDAVADARLGYGEPTKTSSLPWDQASASFHRPELGTSFGIAWRWTATV